MATAEQEVIAGIAAHSGPTGQSQSIQQIQSLIAQVAGHESSVLILGESGTGKEVVARAVHHSSPRRNRPFIAVNCGAIPADLLESGPHRLRSRRTSPGRGGPGRGDGPRSGAYVWSGVRTIRLTAWDPCDRNRCHAVVGTPELAKVLRTRTRTPMAPRRAAFRRTIVHVPGLATPPTPGARKEMTHVREELQVQITVAQERILAAIEADDPYQVARHRARLQDLVDMAARHGIDVHAWVDQTLLPGGQPAGPDQHV